MTIATNSTLTEANRDKLVKYLGQALGTLDYDDDTQRSMYDEIQALRNDVLSRAR